MKVTRLSNFSIRTFIFCLGMILTISASAQQITVTGSVKDSQGEAIIGANVLVKGGTNGTITDFDGNFSISCAKGAPLVFSFVGYTSKEYPATSKMSVILQENSKMLDNVVVIGYGTVRKGDATGALTSITSDPKMKGVAPNATDMLVGKVAGLNVVSDGGAATGGATLKIRGGSSLSASNAPLIILDGVYIDNSGIGGVGNLLSSVNPNDIESFTVLKDASATAIYGSRASNGVIMITTKSGKKGDIKVTYDGNVTVSARKNEIDVMNGDQFRSFIQERFAGLSNEAEVVGKLGQYNTDWQDKIFRTSVSTEHNLSISGAVKELPFRLSLGYTNNNGILKSDKMERYTTSLSLTPSLFDDHLKMNLNGKGMYIRSNFPNRGAIGAAIAMDPTQPVYDSESKYHGYWSWCGSDGNILNVSTKNPVSLIEYRNDDADVYNFIGSAQFDYKVHSFEDLKLHLNLSVDTSHSTGNTSAPYDAPENSRTLGFNNDWNNTRTNSMVDFYATYAKELKPLQSHFDIMGGYSWQHYYLKTAADNIGEYQYNDLGELEPKPTAMNSTLSKSEHYIVSFFGRLNWSLKDRYLLTFTLRDDGSSRFAKKNRWGLFPSVALAWRAIEEDFLKDSEVVSDAKLRLGWGVTGQQDINQGDYPYLGSYSYSTSNASSYYRNGEWIQLLQPNAYNENLKWETTRTYNVGIDYGFLKNRISGSLDLYYRKTTNLINTEAKVASGSNFSEYVVANIGSLSNRGAEFTINTVPVDGKDWRWEIGGNVSFNKSKIIQLTNGDNSTAIRRFGNTGGDGGFQLNAHVVGKEPGMYYVYEQVYDNAGKPLEGVYVDRNSDGKVDENDLYLHNSAAPDLLYGINTKIQYRNWDLSINGHGSLGNYNYYAVAANNAELSPARVYANEFLSNRLTNAFESNFQSKKVLSDYYIRNASFFRIDNINLGYSFKKIASLSVPGRAYMTVQNPIVLTSYEGLDPEVNGGIDANYYPRPISVMFGLNLNF